MDKWHVEEIRIAEKTLYQVQSEDGTEKVGGYYEGKYLADHLAEILNKEA